MQQHVWVWGGIVSAACAGLAQGAVLFSTTWDNPSSSSSDGVLVNGTAANIAITGGGGNNPSPAGFWTVDDPTKVDLSSLNQFTAPASITGGSAVTYGATSGSDIFRKGAVFTSSLGFASPAQQIRYAITTGSVWRPQFNASGVNDGQFNVIFDITAAAGSLNGWELSFNYGTATTGGAWDNNTAAENGTASAIIYQVDTGTGELSSALTFGSVNLSGAGPLATISATNPSSSLGAGTYVLAIRLTGKTKNQRYTIDNLTVSAIPEPAIVSLLGLGGLMLRRRR
jgi:hypothetical protein